MDEPVKTIAVIRGGASVAVPALFRTLVDRWQLVLRIAGILAEAHDLADRACNAGYLSSIRTGERFQIFRDLGPGVTGCHLEGGGVLAASAAVQRDIAEGCDLVVLSKFGKLEAAGRGLFDAFRAAQAARLPILTSVSTALDAAWARFAGSSFIMLPADIDAIEAWRGGWAATRRDAPLENRSTKDLRV
jgi:hypothetical protein